MRAVLSALLLFACATVLAQPAEQEVKAAFLFKFPSFVEWPHQALGDGPIVIGVVGAEEIAAELEQVVPGRTVQGRTVSVRRVREGESMAGLHMIFFGRGQTARLREAVRAAPAQPVLLVADWEGALSEGAVVNFLRSEGRVRFEVALDHAAGRNLRISPRMLSVAHAVRSGRL